MEDLYYMCEGALIWGTVIFTIGLVFYLARRQYRTMKHRRAHRRRRARRAMKQSGGPIGEHRPSHNHP